MKHHQRFEFEISVVAGLMLLVPRLVGAHSATGPCVDCHTMHNSQNGFEVVAGGPQPRLLKFDCKGCHARTFNEANGRASSAGGPAAPQVGSQVAATGPQNSGGYFTNIPGTNEEHSSTHNVYDLGASADPVLLANTPDGPGGGFDVQDSLFPGKPLLHCTSCHDLDIGHAPANSARTGVSTSSYRMLHGVDYVIGQGDIDYESGSGKNIYDAASMNNFCSTCHGLFHGAGTGSSGAWIRHPTDVTTTPGNGNGTSYEGGDKVVPVGDAGPGKTNKVMCLSCHRPHGNAKPDMLRFSYDGSGNLAGDATASLGCETCHGTT